MVKTLKVKSNAHDIPQNLKGPDPRYVKTDALHTLPINGDIQKVRFYPSGMSPVDMSALGIWIKDKPKISNEIKMLDRGKKWFHMDTPDRELFISQDHLNLDMDKPLDMGFNRFVSLSSTHTTGNDQMNDRYLLNPHAMTDVELNMGLRTKNKPSSQQLVIADSGGFQLRSGASTFVDPNDLVNFYGENADEGMTLDIPCGGMPQDIVHACADIQIKNSAFLKQHLNKEVALSNVVHGVEINEMKWYKTYIEKHDADFPIVSFPSSMEMSAVKQLDRLAYLMSNGKQYSQYHMLGLFNIAASILCVRLVHKLSKAGRETFVTSDAATAYYSAKWRVYHTLTSHFNMLERHIIGQISIGGTYTNPYRILPCSCEVCSSIKYTDVMVLVNRVQAYRLIVRHNEVNYAYWLSMMNVYAHEMNDADFRAFALEIVGAVKKKEIKAGLDYIDMLMEHGWDYTHKQFKNITAQLFESQQPGLHDNLPVAEPVIPEKKERTTARLRTVIERYKRFHKGERP